jgi:2,4-dienoyl-CoA reductase (NADPH2)
LWEESVTTNQDIETRENSMSSDHNSTSQTLYPKLFEPIKIHNHLIANRSIMGSMHTGLEEKWGGFDRLAQYFKERAEGGAGLIVTGGIAPNFAGRVSPFGSQLSFAWQVAKHRKVTNAVHQAGGKIAMQILHTGRYAYHPFSVAPSSIKAPISPFKPRALSQRGIHKTIKDFANCAKLAMRAGYDGVEIMGSEGYLINQFIVSKTNKRDDQWGGCFENRIKLALEIIKAVRKATDSNFIIIFRLSMLDLVDKGSSWDEVVQLAKLVESAGASVINTGIGWHEARIPTIVTSVPRANFSWVTERLKPHVSIPLIATNRINTPEVAEKVLSDGQADMVSMARPFLADPEFMAKAKRNQPEFINTCIACNQACLDHAFQNKTVSCLVNPRACEETKINFYPASQSKTVAIVGAGPAGLACAIHSAQRGHKVTLFDASGKIGGQLNVANQVPGKEEFFETIRYFEQMLKKYQVDVRLNTRVSSEDLNVSQFEQVVIATGITPRKLTIDGIDHPSVLSYLDVLREKKTVGKRVAIIGAGGIGFDVAEYLTHEKSLAIDQEAWNKEWGVDTDYRKRGGLADSVVTTSPRKVYLLQRTAGKVGAGLGKTSGWTHRLSLKHKKVKMLNDIEYLKIDDQGLHIKHRGKQQCLEVDQVIVCAGQVSNSQIFDELSQSRGGVHLIGGAELAVELDAKRAIRQGTLLAINI